MMPLLLRPIENGGITDLHRAEPAKGQNVVSLADGQADGSKQGRRAKPRSVTGLRASVFSDAELRAATRKLAEH